MRTVTAVDIAILLFALVMAAAGWRRGGVVGALSLAGFVGGAVAGTRIASAITSGGAASPYAPLYGLIGALLGGTLLALVLEVFGLGLRRRISRVPGLNTVDGVLGAVLTATLALAVCWVGAAVLVQTPGASRELRAQVQRSSILSRLNDALPPSGALLHALARFDPFPSINGPRARVAPPPRGVSRDADVRAAAASVVRVTGTACGLGLEGSGWVAAPGLVVTNAHVVAGEDDTAVQLRGKGPRLDAQAVAFDSRNDVAVLRVGGIGLAPALPIAASPQASDAAAILGFPRNGPYDVRSARLGATQAVISQDAYGRGPLRRSIASFRGLVRPGNSGGPLVDRRGRVVATVFASASGAGPRAGYGVPNALVRRALDGASGAVGTGPCAP